MSPLALRYYQAIANRPAGINTGEWIDPGDSIMASCFAKGIAPSMFRTVQEHWTKVYGTVWPELLR
jgi:hypothetical protein